MPPLVYIIVGLDWLLEYTPISWEEDGTVYPLLLDVFSQVAEGLGLCMDAEVHKHGSDLVVRQERVGHTCGTLRHCHYRLFGDQAFVPVIAK